MGITEMNIHTSTSCTQNTKTTGLCAVDIECSIAFWGCSLGRVYGVSVSTENTCFPSKASANASESSAANLCTAKSEDVWATAHAAAGAASVTTAYSSKSTTTKGGFVYGWFVAEPIKGSADGASVDTTD